MDCLVIIPALNEEETILTVVEDARAALPGATVLVINDCSWDATAGRARAAGAIVLNLPFNLGIGGALQAGYRYAARHGFSVVARLDGDGQHPARHLPEMIAACRGSGANLVIGSRFIDPESDGYRSTCIRRLGISYLRAVLRVLLGIRITDPTSGFRVANRRVIEQASRYFPRDYPEPESIVLWTRQGLKIKEHPVTMMERKAGQSSISTLSTFYYFFKVSLGIVLAWLVRIPDEGS